MNVAEPVMPTYSQQAVSPQHYDRVPNTNYLQQPQYPSVPYLPRVTDEYNYNIRNSIPNQNPSYYYYPRQDYQTPLYGVPTYRGDYQPKPYSFAQPSYTSDDRIETTNPLDYLHEEILQENERERSMNNAAFMQNLALYNKQVDSLQGRQQQIQQIQDLYNLRGVNDPEDYDIEQPSDWYDQTSIVVDPNTFESFKGDYQPQQPQYPYESPPSDYDDEMVKELRGLTKHNRKNSNAAQPMRHLYDDLEWQRDMPQENDWQNDMPQRNDDVPEQEYDDNSDDWINWGGQKRNIQPKKVSLDTKQTQPVVNKYPVPVMSTQAPTTENSKLIEKLHKSGQKEVVLPRPATPVRKPFTEPVMKMMKANSNKADAKPDNSAQTPPIYKTIKEIIDMEQNLSHVSKPIYLLITVLFESFMIHKKVRILFRLISRYKFCVYNNEKRLCAKNRLERQSRRTCHDVENNCVVI